MTQFSLPLLTFLEYSQWGYLLRTAACLEKVSLNRVVTALRCNASIGGVDLTAVRLSQDFLLYMQEPNWDWKFHPSHGARCLYWPLSCTLAADQLVLTWTSASPCWHQLHTHASTCVTCFGNLLQYPCTAQLNIGLLEWDAYTIPLERHRSKYITILTKSSGGLEQFIKYIKTWAFHSACEDLFPLWRHSLI